jgi:hypothetical protein
MRTIKTFEQFSSPGLLLPGFEKYLPQKIEVFKQVEGQMLDRTFNIGNIIENANMTQIIYTADKSLFGHPDEMSMDIYYLENGSIKLDFDIAYGNIITCEFSCRPPNDIDIIQYTSYGSKWDPSNTLFALSDETIKTLTNFINMVEGFSITEKDLYFLAKR